jgi:hypothetical protein
MVSLPSFGLNQYQRTAQLYPAILAVAPALAVSVVWVPKALGLVGGAGSIGVVGALVILLIQIGRRLGRSAEAKWRLGIPVTIAALRHDNNLLPPPTLARYHAAFTRHKLRMPSLEEQRRDPVGADTAYADAASWLRDRTRDEKRFPLIHVENRNYGFRRNLLGLKPIGLVICSCAAPLDAGLALALHPTGDLMIAAWLLLAALIGGIATWSLVVTKGFVLDASRGYAVQLLAASDQILPPAPAKRGRSSSRVAE